MNEEGLPLDHPSPARPHRLYVAVTNHCNRACPWCSTCSSPAGATWLTLAQLQGLMPEAGEFELQLEGGEPTVHPQFWEMVAYARSLERCTKLILCTNGVAIPRAEVRLQRWLARMGRPLIIKMSINHHLLERDAGLLDLAVALQRLAQQEPDDLQVIFNVRLRQGTPDDDRWVEQRVEAAGLRADANVFFLQRYGFAEDEAGWERPFLAGHNFSMVNPDGEIYGTDLVARSEGMRKLR